MSLSSVSIVNTYYTRAYISLQLADIIAFAKCHPFLLILILNVPSYIDTTIEPSA